VYNHCVHFHDGYTGSSLHVGLRVESDELCIGKREELVFDAFIDSEPVKRAYGSDMAGLRSLTTVRANEFWICCSSLVQGTVEYFC